MVSWNFRNTSTADSATLIANGGLGAGGNISFVQNSTGGTSRVEVFGNGLLDISSHNAPGATIGSLEGSGEVFLGARNLTVGSNNLSTIFSGVIQDGGGGGGVGGSFTKIGSGTLTFQGGATNNYIANTVGLGLVSGSIINLNFSGAPDTIRSLIVDGMAQVPGIYGSAASGAPHQLPEFAGLGTVQVVTPALQLTAAVSRKTHSAAGDFDINLPLAGAPGVECRNTSGTQTLVFTTSNNLVSGNASVTTGTGTISGSPTFSGNTMTVNLTGVTDVQRITVTLSNVTDNFAQVLPNTPVTMGVLIGDAAGTGNGSVGAADVGFVKSKSGQTTDATNFRADVAVNGSIGASDIGLTKSKSGNVLPP